MDPKATINYHIIDKLFSWIPRSKLKNRNFTIICNDCIGGGIYHKLGLQYSSPTVGLFIFSDDYVKMLENLPHYLNQPLKFKETSTHTKANELRKTNPYPIGVLGDVEIQFLHYKNPVEAADKWSRRTKRVNFNNLFFTYSDSDTDEVTGDLLSRYQKLPFDHKIYFSTEPRNFPNTIVIKDYKGHIGNSTRNRKYEKYLDVIKWLNGDKKFF
jgi:uncharacterized protein (DUF1919 family)